MRFLAKLIDKIKEIFDDFWLVYDMLKSLKKDFED